MDIPHTFFASAREHKVLYWTGALIFAALIFHAGVAVGSHRHFHGYDRPHGFREYGFIADGHGTVGTIESVASSSLTLSTYGGETTQILFDDTTSIRDATGPSTTGALVTGAHIVVLGTPRDDGSLDARLIRIGTTRRAKSRQ